MLFWGAEWTFFRPDVDWIGAGSSVAELPIVTCMKEAKTQKGLGL